MSADERFSFQRNTHSDCWFHYSSDLGIVPNETKLNICQELLRQREQFNTGLKNSVLLGVCSPLTTQSITIWCCWVVARSVLRCTCSDTQPWCHGVLLHPGVNFTSLQQGEKLNHWRSAKTRFLQELSCSLLILIVCLLIKSLLLIFENREFTVKLCGVQQLKMIIYLMQDS